MATANEIVKQLSDVLRDGMKHYIGRGELVNEAATLSLIIQPALDTLGYPASHRIPEYGEQRNRIDETCYLMPIAGSNPGHAALIVEAKQWGTPFDTKSASQPRYSTPDRQIQRYLKQHKASGPNTIGVLTDGAKWRIYRRGGAAANPDVEVVDEFNLEDLAGPGQSLMGVGPPIEERLQELVDFLGRGKIATQTSQTSFAAPPNLADSLFAEFRDGFQPEGLLKNIANEPDLIVENSLTGDMQLQGVAKDAHNRDWREYAYVKANPMTTENPMLFESRAVLAAVQYHYQPGKGLTRPDVALCARTFARSDESNVGVALAYTIGPDDDIEARLAVAAGSQVNMTAPFDPTLPSPSARTAIDQLLRLLRSDSQSLTADKLLQPLEAAPLRQQFYREVDAWTRRIHRGKSLPERMAVMRHLVRVMFSWILKEEYIIPPELFEQGFIKANLASEDDYHHRVLGFLFHQRLNVDGPQREPFPAATGETGAIGEAMDATPFLNGSLFAEHSDDSNLDLKSADYWNASQDEPGLFTILSRYHWTMDEHRPEESEQTLDPELLSNLFERLIIPTQEGEEAPLRQPQGTYYTPADVADEMVKDALAAAVKEQAPAKITEAQLLELFGESDAPLPEMSKAQCGKLARRIKELRIFDPAVGSGEFLFSSLAALQRALRKLEPDGVNHAEDIIKNQLAGQDINPLAVQIARLRLFIAIIAARKESATPDSLTRMAPLPNLEARIVCADSLETRADPQWRPGHPGQLDTADTEVLEALAAIGENRSQWFDAHTEDAKEFLKSQDGILRDRLRVRLQQLNLASPELVALAESPLFDVNPVPAKTDARLLFYENPWRGFDIVIGNPPYEALSKTKDQAARRRLADEKSYETTNVGDLYSLFCETALALANPEGGVVEMIVPLSIAFGQQQRTLRQAFGSQCAQIDLRHYDVRPDPPFNASPTVKTPGNSQRATTLTAVLGKSEGSWIMSTGLQRWPRSVRNLCLRSRTSVQLPSLSFVTDIHVSGQWARIPTQQIAKFVQVVASQTRTVGSFRRTQGINLAFPETPRYFVSSLPERSVTPRNEQPFTVTDVDELRLLMAVLNGHVAYGWWRVFGDGYHLKPIDLESLVLSQPRNRKGKDGGVWFGHPGW